MVRYPLLTRGEPWAKHLTKASLSQVTGDGKELILVTGDTLCFCALSTDAAGHPCILTSLEHAVTESGAISSISLSADSRNLLVSVGRAEIHLWQLHKEDGALGGRLIQWFDRPACLYFSKSNPSLPSKLLTPIEINLW